MRSTCISLMAVTIYWTLLWCLLATSCTHRLWNSTSVVPTASIFLQHYYLNLLKGVICWENDFRSDWLIAQSCIFCYIQWCCNCCNYILWKSYLVWCHFYYSVHSSLIYMFGQLCTKTWWTTWCETECFWKSNLCNCLSESGLGKLFNLLICIGY